MFDNVIWFWVIFAGLLGFLGAVADAVAAKKDDDK